jgi:hypothetical protein
MATVASSEWPGATVGGGNRGRGSGRGRCCGGCWNCGGCGHPHDACPSPKKEEKDGAKSENKEENKNSSNSQSSSSNSASHSSHPQAQSKGNSSSQKSSANAALSDNCGGTWSAIDEDINTYDFLDFDEEPTFDEGLALASGHADWDLYDSGASHHMCPHRDDFTTFELIPPYSLTAANKESFQAHGVGDNCHRT